MGGNMGRGDLAYGSNLHDIFSNMYTDIGIHKVLIDVKR